MTRNEAYYQDVSHMTMAQLKEAISALQPYKGIAQAQARLGDLRKEVRTRNVRK